MKRNRLVHSKCNSLQSQIFCSPPVIPSISISSVLDEIRWNKDKTEEPFQSHQPSLNLCVLGQVIQLSMNRQEESESEVTREI